MAFAGALNTNGRVGCCRRLSKLPHPKVRTERSIQGETGLLTAENVELLMKVTLACAISATDRVGCSHRVSKLPHLPESVPKSPSRRDRITEKVNSYC